MRSDLEIAKSAKLKTIREIGDEIGVTFEELEPYGCNAAKINLSILDRLADRPQGKYIVVTAITPTPLGEGKTVTTIGLSMALNRIGQNAVCAIRQPSMGPTFGIKGGAAGGGYSQVVPMENFNLHFTGDMHAVSSAHNLLAAFLDNHLYHGNTMNIDPYSITWPRVLDMSDRSLRSVLLGLGTKTNGPLRESKWDITAASEVMAILGLTHHIRDLRERLGRIVVGYTSTGEAVTADSLKAAGAMTVLLYEAIKPNLIQTFENTPALVHTGPFANIAHGNSSILADKIGLRLAEFVVTESGFGADIGAEKFFNIKCREMDKRPDAAVLVCTVRALKMHSGKVSVVAGKPLDPELLNAHPQLVEEGLGNLIKQIENVQMHGVPVVVAINRFDSDAPEELQLIKDAALQAGAVDVVESHLWAQGSAGGEELAHAVVKAAQQPSDFRHLYDTAWSVEKKIETIATHVYGASEIEYSVEARKQIQSYKDLGLADVPICMAKTHLSLSADPKLKGRPKDFYIHVREVRAAVGAGFLYPILGNMMTMPGLPTVPAGEHIDIDENGEIVGLS